MLEEAVVILGPRGERFVFVPFTDGTSEREAYLLYAFRGRPTKVIAFTLSLNSQVSRGRFGPDARGGRHDLPASLSRMSFLPTKAYPIAAQDLFSVDEVYVICDYGECEGMSQIIYLDEGGYLAEDEMTTEGLREWVNCVRAWCPAAVIACIRRAALAFLKCTALSCAGVVVGCTLQELWQ